MNPSWNSHYVSEHRRLQAEWKQNSPELPAAARHPGRWKQAAKDFILPIDFAAHNIWEPIRDEVIAYFEAKRIA
jgi:hypothetical protein